ncbi:response regulator transcription factor [Poseidonibacter lekithochrous]|uniref:response regulator transcription factor n=1 Tax=Poseidonibacter TaxID=2321187 RepID=UPI001C085CCF|nr:MULTISPECIES: response regulator transcription factor [Poseidonibacter]MBU3014550.1 response regulator transcription factor [Poseidonibacter lekithochrous]MDO6827848.1 response regulator transcription factor [Poseidonibacter sp. 1_MG-2023]
MKILILEDNERLLNVMKMALEKESYSVDTFIDGDEALNVLDNGYNCFILDINVPHIDGISLLELLRINHKETPVIIISSNHDLEKIQKSYELGCSDYIKKPFYILELVQKVKKLCVIQKRFLKFDEVYEFDFINHILYENKKEIELTKKEILFLELFSKNLHHVATYEEIEEYVWEGDDTNLTNIRAMIKRLRKKIPNDAIVITKGMGYSLNKNVKLI